MRPPRRNLPCMGWRWLPSQTPDSALTEPEDPNDPGPAQPRRRRSRALELSRACSNGLHAASSRRSRGQSPLPTTPSSLDGTHLTWPPSRLHSCLPLAATTRRQGHPPASRTTLPFASHVDLPQTGRHLSQAAQMGRVSRKGGPPVPVACLRQTRLRGPERARTATAHEATRLDARRDSVLDLDLGLGDPSSDPRQHTRHHPTTTFRNDESMVWPSAQPQLTPNHHEVLACYDSWLHSPHCPVS